MPEGDWGGMIRGTEALPGVVVQCWVSGGAAGDG